MSPFIWTLRQAKRLIVTIVGVTVLGIGIAMIVLPGTAIVVVPIGLGILATEFVWARTLLKRANGHIARLRAGKPLRGKEGIDA